MADHITPSQRSEKAIKAMMATRESRRYIWELLSRCGVLQSTFSPDALVLSFNEGQRNIGLSVFSDIDVHCPEQYLLMVKEAKEDNEYDRLHNDDDRADDTGTGYDFDNA